MFSYAAGGVVAGRQNRGELYRRQKLKDPDGEEVHGHIHTVGQSASVA